MVTIADKPTEKHMAGATIEDWNKGLEKQLIR